MTSASVYVVQPLLAGYRREMLTTLGSRYRLALLGDRSEEGRKGFQAVDLGTGVRRIHAPIRALAGDRLFYQCNVLSQPYRPGDTIIAFGNPRFVSLWLLLLWGRLRGVRILVHGQGNYAHPQAGPLRRWMYRTLCRLAHRYVCYNGYVRSEMLRIGCDGRKLAVAENSLLVESTVDSSDRDYRVSGVLFVGRLRTGCSLETAVEAVSRLRSFDEDVRLHVVGGGEDEGRHRQRFSSLEWVIFHGPVYDQAKIADISRRCRVGCYPGAAGLSVVHYFALSLPVVVHSRVHLHMGPEPAYVRDGHNGFLFDPAGDTAEALYRTLLRAWRLDAQALREIGAAARQTYRSLTMPTLGERFLAILDETS